MPGLGFELEMSQGTPRGASTCRACRGRRFGRGYHPAASPSVSPRDLHSALFPCLSPRAANPSRLPASFAHNPPFPTPTPLLSPPPLPSPQVGEFVASLRKPRAIIILVQAGKPVDDTIEVLSQFLEPGDLIIDGGNEWYPNTTRRGEALRGKGILFMGMGVSGGEEGARNGPSLMPGGPREAYDMVAPILSKIAAITDSGPCVTYIGDLGSGNYVKMVHNGIEYGDMQLIAEAYDILRQVGGLSNDDLAAVFDEWNAGELNSFLIEITAQIFKKRDPDTGGWVVDAILDKTGMKGTGRWTIQEAAERSIAAPTMAAALDGRYLSGLKEERVAASKVLSGPTDMPKVDRAQLVDDVRQALYAAKICSYAQGMNLIREAAAQLKWSVDLGECARIWKGGCIIRAKVRRREG